MLFADVCRAGRPDQAVRGLADAELAALDAGLAELPQGGIPGVVAALAACEMRRRWLAEQAARKERIS